MNKYTLALLIVLIAGCSGSPKIDTQYYLLMPDIRRVSAENEKQSTNIKTQVIILNRIGLATYLDQQGIVLLTDRHQIKVAHYHRWAEPLDQNIYRFMLETLSAHASKYQYHKKSGSSDHMSNLELSVEFDQFNGTSKGDALVAGNWQLRDTSQNTLIISESFYYDQPLPEDGYSALVNELAGILNQISITMEDTITSH